MIGSSRDGQPATSVQPLIEPGASATRLLATVEPLAETRGWRGQERRSSPLEAMGSFTERRKWDPFPRALSAMMWASASAFCEYSKVATVRPPISQTAQTIRIRGPATGLDRNGGGSERSRAGLRAPESAGVFKPSASAASAAARSSCRLSVRRAMTGLVPLRSVVNPTSRARRFFQKDLRLVRPAGSF
jgi:hypothetical protein